MTARSKPTTIRVPLSVQANVLVLPIGCLSLNPFQLFSRGLHRGVGQNLVGLIDDVAFGIGGFSLLGLVDDLGLNLGRGFRLRSFRGVTVDDAEANGEGGLIDGVKAVQTKLFDTLVKDGLEVINPVGEAYNALEAQAVATVDDPSTFDETGAQVYQKGYRMGNKVLRAAMVTVTTGGPKRPAPEETEEQE